MTKELNAPTPFYMYFWFRNLFFRVARIGNFKNGNKKIILPFHSYRFGFSWGRLYWRFYLALPSVDRQYLVVFFWNCPFDFVLFSFLIKLGKTDGIFIKWFCTRSVGFGRPFQKIRGETSATCLTCAGKFRWFAPKNKMPALVYFRIECLRKNFEIIGITEII